MNLLCLSVTVKMTFTSSDRVRNVCIGRVSSPALDDPEATALAGGVCAGDEEEAGAWGAGVVCATAQQQNSVTTASNADIFLGSM